MVNFKKVFYFALMVLIPIGIIWGLYELQKKSFYGNSISNLNVPDVSSSDWVYGNLSAPIKLIEYGDFECPACAFYAPLLKKLVDESENKLLLVFRHFPLKTIHKNALISAYAAEAAGKQGKFWEMLEKIYENQKEWNYLKENEAKDIFIKYAEDLKLDISKFKEDINSQEIIKKIEDSYEESLKLNLSYTPTFILNGKIIQNPQNYDEFRKKIEEKLSHLE
jgi:protein-disulfide isomerase